MADNFEFGGKKTVPNQKLVTIHRIPLNKGNGFLGINKSSFEKALRKMGSRNYACFTLYLWLLANSNGYQFGLSPEAIENQIGMPKSTVRDLVNRLIKYGYLIRKEEGSNRYDFYEDPDELRGFDFSEPLDR